MPVIKIEMQRDTYQDSVWDMPLEQHRDFAGHALISAVIVSAMLVAVAYWGCR